jgi:hypothetical protein
MRESGSLLSSELIDKADQIDDRWGQIRVQFKATFAELVVLLKPVIEGLQWLVSTALKGLQLMVQAFKGLAGAIGAVAAVVTGADMQTAWDVWLKMSEDTGADLHGQPAGAGGPQPGSPATGPTLQEMLAEQRALSLSMQPLSAQRIAALEDLAAAQKELDRVMAEGNRAGKHDPKAMIAAGLVVTKARVELASIDEQMAEMTRKHQERVVKMVALEASMLSLQEQRVHAAEELAAAERDRAETTDVVKMVAAEERRLAALKKLRDLEEQISRSTAEQQNQAALDLADATAQRLAARRADLEGDFARTAAEKWSERRQILEQEITNQRTLLSLLEAKRDAARASGDLAAAGIFDQSARQAGTGLAALQDQAAGLGPDPNSWSQQTEDALTRLRESWGTTAQQIGRGVAGIAQAFSSGLGAALTGLIDRTMTWRDALLSIGRSVVTSIIGAFSEMAAQWVAKQLMMALFGTALRAAQLAALAPVAAASAAMWAPAATAASIATLGGAAITGAAAAKIAMLSSVVGFAGGGLVAGPGTGTSDSIPARLSNGEFVMRAAAVDRFGADFLSTLNGGALDLSALPGSAAAGGAADRPMTVVVVSSQREATRIARHSAARGDIVRIVQEDFGLPPKA